MHRTSEVANRPRAAPDIGVDESVESHAVKPPKKARDKMAKRKIEN